MGSALEPSKKHFGECSIAFEPPDLLITVVAGELTAPQVTAMFEECHRCLDGRASPHDSLVGISDLRLVSMEVRKLAIGRSQKLGAAACTAVYGGSSQMRVIFSLFLRALELLAPRSKSGPVRFFETEAEARAWIAERRRATR